MLAALLAGFLLAGRARAEPGDAAAASVDVTIVGGGSDAEPLMDTIRELLGRLGLTVSGHFQRTDALAGPARAHVEIDLGVPGEVVLSVRSDAAHAPVRRTIARDGSGSIVREEVADAVRSAVESQLLSDEQRAAAPAPASPPEVAPPAVTPATPPSPSVTAPVPTKESPTAESPAVAPRPSSPWFAVDVTTLAGAGPFATNSGIVGRFGGGLSLASRRGLRPSLAVTGQALLPFDATSDNVSAHATIESVRVVPSIEALRSYSWFALEVGAGLGVDVLNVYPNPTSVPAGSHTVGSLRTDPIACVILVGHFALTPGVVLTLAIAADVDPSARQYLVKSDTTAVGDPVTSGTVLSPWVVRPMVQAGFTFTAFGEGLFASAGR